MRSCPICGRDNQSQPLLAYSLPPWELKRCLGRGLVPLVNPPAYASLEDEFAWENTWAKEDEKRRLRNPALYHLGRGLQAIPRRLFRRDKLGAWIRRFVAPGPVLDVGCGGGVVLAALPAHFIPFGIEVSKRLAQVAQSRFAPRGGRVLQGDALSVIQQFAAKSFTGVIMSSVPGARGRSPARAGLGSRFNVPAGETDCKGAELRQLEPPGAPDALVRIPLP